MFVPKTELGVLELNALLFICQFQGLPFGTKDLTLYLSCDRTTAYRKLKSLERKGLIRLEKGRKKTYRAFVVKQKKFFQIPRLALEENFLTPLERFVYCRLQSIGKRRIRISLTKTAKLLKIRKERLKTALLSLQRKGLINLSIDRFGATVVFNSPKQFNFRRITMEDKLIPTRNFKIVIPTKETAGIRERETVEIAGKIYSVWTDFTDAELMECVKRGEIPLYAARYFDYYLKLAVWLTKVYAEAVNNLIVSRPSRVPNRLNEIEAKKHVFRLVQTLSSALVPHDLLRINYTEAGEKIRKALETNPVEFSYFAGGYARALLDRAVRGIGKKESPLSYYAEADVEDGKPYVKLKKAPFIEKKIPISQYRERIENTVLVTSPEKEKLWKKKKQALAEKVYLSKRLLEEAYRRKKILLDRTYPLPLARALTEKFALYQKALEKVEKLQERIDRFKRLISEEPELAEYYHQDLKETEQELKRALSELSEREKQLDAVLNRIADYEAKAG